MLFQSIVACTALRSRLAQRAHRLSRLTLPPPAAHVVLQSELTQRRRAVPLSDLLPLPSAKFRRKKNEQSQAARRNHFGLKFLFEPIHNCRKPLLFALNRFRLFMSVMVDCVRLCFRTPSLFAVTPFGTVCVRNSIGCFDRFWVNIVKTC